MKLPALKSLELIREFLPEIAGLIKSKGKKRPVLAGEGLYNFLTRSLGVIKLLQIPVVLPKSLMEVFIPKLTASVTKKTDASGQSYFSLDSLINFDWKIALGRNAVSFQEFAELVKNSKGLIRFFTAAWPEKSGMKWWTNFSQTPA